MDFQIQVITADHQNGPRSIQLNVTKEIIRMQIWGCVPTCITVGNDSCKIFRYSSRNVSCCLILYKFFIWFPSQYNSYQNLIFISVCIMSVWYVQCSRQSRTNTTVLCCHYTDTRRQLLALKRAACDKPLMWTWSEPVAWGTRWMVIGLLCQKHRLRGGHVGCL
jgi:hypothetical protein